MGVAYTVKRLFLRPVPQHLVVVISSRVIVLTLEVELLNGHRMQTIFITNQEI